MNDRTDITTDRVTDAAARARDALTEHERHLYGTDEHAEACGALAARVGALLAAIDDEQRRRAAQVERDGKAANPGRVAGVIADASTEDEARYLITRMREVADELEARVALTEEARHEREEATAEWAFGVEDEQS